MRYELSDFEWAAIRSRLPNKPRDVPRVDDRRVLSGIFWALKSGAPWRDLAECFGPYTTCYNRFVCDSLSDAVDGGDGDVRPGRGSCPRRVTAVSGVWRLIGDAGARGA
jgi:hypothetical protein